MSRDQRNSVGVIDEAIQVADDATNDFDEKPRQQHASFDTSAHSVSKHGAANQRN